MKGRMGLPLMRDIALERVSMKIGEGACWRPPRRGFRLIVFHSEKSLNGEIFLDYDTLWPFS